MSIDTESIKAKDIFNLRKNLIAKYTPKRGWNEVTIVIYHEGVGQYKQPVVKDYIGTLYIYGEPKNMSYTWTINYKNNWGNYRHYLPKSKPYDVNPTNGKLIKN